MMNITYITAFLFITLAILFSVYVLFFSKQGGQDAWKVRVNQRLSQLNMLLTTENSEIRQNMLVEADKLLDYVLKKRNRPGRTMSERLKNSKKLFSKDQYNSIRQAHRLRNQIVHEFDIKIKDSEIVKNFNVLKKAIRDIL